MLDDAYAEKLNTLLELLMTLPLPPPINPDDPWYPDDLFWAADSDNPMGADELLQRLKSTFGRWPFEFQENSEGLWQVVGALRVVIGELDENADHDELLTWVDDLLDSAEIFHKERQASPMASDDELGSDVRHNDDSDDSEWDELDPSESPAVSKLQKDRASNLPTSSATKQMTLPFRKISHVKYLAQSARQWERGKIISAQLRAAQEIKSEDRDLARKRGQNERKRKSRAKKRALEVETGLRDATTGKKLRKTVAQVLSQRASANSHGLTHDEFRHHASKSHRQVKLGGERSRAKRDAKPKRMNWFHHFLFRQIDDASKILGFSNVSSVVKYLRLKDKIFDKLHPAVLRKWVARHPDGRLGWSPKTMERVARGGAPGSRGRPTLEGLVPEPFQNAARQLRALRKARITVTGNVARSVVLAHTQLHKHRHPRLEQFKASFSWMRKFLRDRLGWSYRHATRAGQKTPRDWETLCARTHARIVYVLRMNNIRDPKLFINVDQMGLLMVPTGHTTWHERGAKQVENESHGDKRQTTIVTAISCDGDILPFQTVWDGSTDDSLPSTGAYKRDEADKLGFTYAHGDTRHWASRASMKAWVKEILMPFVNRVIKEKNYPANQKCILLLDVWKIHIANSQPGDFLPWLRKQYPNIIPIFVPGGCTGLFQPADVGMQRLIKHKIKQSALDFFVATTTRQLKAGCSPEEVVLPLDKPTLRDATVSWTVDAFNYFTKRRDIVRQAWSNSRVRHLSLSWESLTSDDAYKHYEGLLTSDPIFAKGILDSLPAFTVDESFEALPENEQGDTCADDDLTISVDVLASAEFNDAVAEGCVYEDGVLVSTAGCDDFEPLEIESSESSSESEHGGTDMDDELRNDIPEATPMPLEPDNCFGVTLNMQLSPVLLDDFDVPHSPLPPTSDVHTGKNPNECIDSVRVTATASLDMASDPPTIPASSEGVNTAADFLVNITQDGKTHPAALCTPPRPKRKRGARKRQLVTSDTDDSSDIPPAKRHKTNGNKKKASTMTTVTHKPAKQLQSSVAVAAVESSVTKAHAQPDAPGQLRRPARKINATARSKWVDPDPALSRDIDKELERMEQSKRRRGGR